jgi:hypothetical protein
MSVSVDLAVGVNIEKFLLHYKQFFEKSTINVRKW